MPTTRSKVSAISTGSADDPAAPCFFRLEMSSPCGGLLASMESVVGTPPKWVMRYFSTSFQWWVMKFRLRAPCGLGGKTTSTYLLESALRRAGHLTGLIGGVETRIAGETARSQLTTPEATDLQALFATMAERGVTAAAMEVSSHALALGRVAGTSYE